jgi:enamine deaminase RidA (YjgF/YER057c/UK114 family)
MGAAAGRVHCAGHYVFAHGIAGNGADCAEGLRAAMADLDATLRSAGSAMDRVQRITLYVRDAAKTSSSLAGMSPGDIPGAQLSVDLTARSTVVEMASLRDDVHVELEATATLVDAA